MKSFSENMCPELHIYWSEKVLINGKGYSSTDQQTAEIVDRFDDDQRALTLLLRLLCAMARPQSAHARLGNVVPSPRHHIDFQREQGPPRGAVTVSQPLWSSAFLEPSDSSIHADERVSSQSTAASYDFTAHLKPRQLRRPLKCGDAVRLVRRPGGLKPPVHGWGPREVPPHPTSHGIVRKILRGNECLAHFQLEDTTLRLHFSEIRMLWERWDGSKPIMKWTTVPLIDGAGAVEGSSRPMSAPAARSHAENTRVGPSHLRPASAHATTTATADAIYRERRPKPGANAVRNVSHLVHSSYNQQVLKAGESSLRYADAERIRRLALPPGADERQKHELALLRLREKEERRALRRVENRLHKRSGRAMTRRAPRPPSAPNAPVSKYRRERERAGRVRGSAVIPGGDAAALSIQSAYRGHLARRELQAKKQQYAEEKEWDDLEKEAAQRASAAAHAAGRPRVGFGTTGKRPSSASARVGAGQDRITLAAHIFAGGDDGLPRRPMSAQPRVANVPGASGTNGTASADERTSIIGSNGAAMGIYRARPVHKKAGGTKAIEVARAPGMESKRQDEQAKAAREKRAAEKAAKEADKEKLAEEAAQRAQARQRAWRKQEHLRLKSAEARMRSDQQQDIGMEEERVETKIETDSLGVAPRLQRNAQEEVAVAADVALKDLARPGQRYPQTNVEPHGTTPKGMSEKNRRSAKEKETGSSNDGARVKLAGTTSQPASKAAAVQPTLTHARKQNLNPEPETQSEPEPEPKPKPKLGLEVGSKVSSTRPMAGRKHQNPWEKKHKTVGKSATPSSVVAVDQGPATETEKKTTESSASAAVQERVGSEVKLLGVAATSGSDKETEEERKKRLREEDRAARKAKREARLKTQTASPQLPLQIQGKLETQPEPETQPEAKRQPQPQPQPEPEPLIKEPEQAAETEEERKKRLREADKAARKAKREAKLQAQQADAAGGGGGGGGAGAAAAAAAAVAAAAAATVPAPAPALEPVGPAAAVAAGDFEDDLPIGSGSDDGSIFAGLSDPEAVVEFSDDEF